MIRLPPRSTRTDTRCHYTTLFLSPDRRPSQPASGVPSLVAFEPKRAECQPAAADPPLHPDLADRRSEEHPSELQSPMRISSAVFCLNNKNTRPKQRIRGRNL